MLFPEIDLNSGENVAVGDRTMWGPDGGPNAVSGRFKIKYSSDAIHIAGDVTYKELGADYFERRSKTQITRRLVKRLESLGHTVEIRPAA